MTAALVGSQDAIAGFLVHLVISAVIGIIYTLAAGNLPAAAQYDPATLLGPLVIMPARPAAAGRARHRQSPAAGR